MNSTYTNWIDDERCCYDTPKPYKNEDVFDMRKMCKELIKEEEERLMSENYNSYDYEYKCEFYDYGFFNFDDFDYDLIEKCEEKEKEEYENDEVEVESDTQNNADLLINDKFMYT